MGQDDKKTQDVLLYLETRPTIIELRQLYAKLLAGVTKDVDYDQCSHRFKSQAAKADLNHLTLELARKWDRLQPTPKN